MNELPAGPPRGLWTTVRSMRDPYGALARYAARYADPFTICLPLQAPIVVTADPVAIRSVFAADAETFGASGAKLMGPVLGPGSVLVLEGAAHRRARKLLNPPFHGERMRAHGQRMREVTQRRSAGLAAGSRFSVQELAATISLEVILQTIFGVHDGNRVAQFEHAVHALMASLGVFVGSGWLRHSFGGIGPWARFQRRRAALAALVEQEIAARRRSEANTDDILSMLLQARYEDGGAMSDSDVFDQLLTLIAAGHETTMITLGWAIYWLHRNPHALERLHAELDACAGEADALTRLPYLQAVIEETLRLYPVVPLGTRLLARPFELKGHVLPAGVAIGVAAGLVHYRADLYPEPERFEPERFLGKSFGPAEYFPFGGGVRRCLGAAFAMYEIKIVLGTLLRTLRLQRCDDRPVRPAMRAAGVGPGRSVDMIVRERRAQ